MSRTITAVATRTMCQSMAEEKGKRCDIQYVALCVVGMYGSHVHTQITLFTERHCHWPHCTTCRLRGGRGACRCRLRVTQSTFCAESRNAKGIPKAKKKAPKSENGIGKTQPAGAAPPPAEPRGGAEVRGGRVVAIVCPVQASRRVTTA